MGQEYKYTYHLLSLLLFLLCSLSLKCPQCSQFKKKKKLCGCGVDKFDILNKTFIVLYKNKPIYLTEWAFERVYYPLKESTMSKRYKQDITDPTKNYRTVGWDKYVVRSDFNSWLKVCLPQIIHFTGLQECLESSIIYHHNSHGT